MTDKQTEFEKHGYRSALMGFLRISTRTLFSLKEPQTRTIATLLQARHTNPGNIYLTCIYKCRLSYIYSEVGTSPLLLHDLLCSLKLDTYFPINIIMPPEYILKPMTLGNPQVGLCFCWPEI